jgi:hypothetical protein
MASPATLQERRAKLCKARDYLLALHTRGLRWSPADSAEYRAIEVELAAIETQLAQFPQ